MFLAGHLADRRPRSSASSSRRSRRRCSPTTTPTSSPATSAGSRCPPPTATPSTGTPSRPTCASPRTSRAWQLEPAPVDRHRRRPGAGQARRLGHHRPHLPGRLDQGRQPGRQYLAEHGVRAQGLQLLRLAPRQPRGDDPRHLRQHPAAQPAAATASRAASPATSPAGGEQTTIYDASQQLPGRRHPAGGPGRQGVRLRLLARLGGQGHRAARRQGRHRRVLRADPPLQPDRHGRPAAAVPGGPERRVARADRHRDVRRHRRHRAERRVAPRGP